MIFGLKGIFGIEIKRFRKIQISKYSKKTPNKGLKFTQIFLNNLNSKETKLFCNYFPSFENQSKFEKQFLKMQENKQEQQHLKFKKVCLGGTFDRLHAGHHILLNKAIESSSSIVIIGLTDDSMNKSKKYAEFIEPYEVRKQNILNYLNSKNSKLDYQIFRLNDSYGPALIDSEIEAMIVSEETFKSAEKCNLLRKEKINARIENNFDFNTSK